MSRIHLLTPSVLPGDAVSNDVLGMQRWFRSRGYPIRVYARYCHPSLRDRVQPHRAYRKYLGKRQDVLLYHHSVGWPGGLALYEASRNRKVVKYHNVTPPAFYRPYNLGHAGACMKGLRETRQLIETVPERLLADSDFNARDLIALGADPAACRTVPPFHGLDRLDAVGAEPRLARIWHGRPFFLFVGRLAPNKGQRHLIRAFAHYRHYLGGRARLVLVGPFDPGLTRYHEELRQEVRRHRLQGLVHLAGKVSPRRLKTYYTLASVFLCASEHEGFCVPLVEAMYYGIPVVAYGSSAIPGTLGDTGLVWDRPAPALLAESARLIEECPQVREALVQGQRARFAAHFTADAVARRLEEALAPVLCARRPQAGVTR